MTTTSTTESCLSYHLESHLSARRPNPPAPQMGHCFLTTWLRLLFRVTMLSRVVMDMSCVPEFLPLSNLSLRMKTHRVHRLRIVRVISHRLAPWVQQRLASPWFLDPASRWDTERASWKRPHAKKKQGDTLHSLMCNPPYLAVALMRDSNSRPSRLAATNHTQNLRSDRVGFHQIPKLSENLVVKALYGICNDLRDGCRDRWRSYRRDPRSSCWRC